MTSNRELCQNIINDLNENVQNSIPSIYQLLRVGVGIICHARSCYASTPRKPEKGNRRQRKRISPRPKRLQCWEGSHKESLEIQKKIEIVISVENHRENHRKVVCAREGTVPNALMSLREREKSRYSSKCGRLSVSNLMRKPPSFVVV